jgi:hypothetical protein
MADTDVTFHTMNTILAKSNTAVADKSHNFFIVSTQRTTRTSQYFVLTINNDVKE